MYFTIAKVSSVAAAAAMIAAVAAAPADARDWRRSVDRHYDTVEETRYVPSGDNPQWGFTLDTVVADMAWRERTARLLRDLPKPGVEPAARDSEQIADRPAAPKFRFSF